MKINMQMHLTNENIANLHGTIGDLDELNASLMTFVSENTGTMVDPQPALEEIIADFLSEDRQYHFKHNSGSLDIGVYPSLSGLLIDIEGELDETGTNLVLEGMGIYYQLMSSFLKMVPVANFKNWYARVVQYHSKDNAIQQQKSA